MILNLLSLSLSLSLTLCITKVLHTTRLWGKNEVHTCLH
jgi:hypothetical protein